MKKIFFGGLFLIIISQTLIGCKKQKIGTNEISSLRKSFSVENEMLVFKTVEEFDDLISRSNDSIIKEIIDEPFISYWETIDDDSLNVLNDVFMAAVLNKNFLIQIGNYVYKVNKPEEKVFALHTNRIDLLNELVEENTKNINILCFSVEDDVFDLLNEYSEGTTTIKSNESCANSNQKNNGGWKEYATLLDENNTYGNGTNKTYKFSVFYKVRYDNWGINRKLFVRFKHKATGGTYDATHFTPVYEYSYKNKKGHTGSDNVYPSYDFALNPETTLSTHYVYLDKNRPVELYKGTRCLVTYSLKSWVWFRNRKTLKPQLYPSNGNLLIKHDD